MKKFGFVCLMILSFPALAYERKVLKPAYFIPEGATDYTEKLPEFNYPRNDEIQQAKIIEVIREEDIGDMIPLEDEGEIPLTNVDIIPLQENEHINYNRYDLTNSPEYKEKYSDYIEDLKVIAATGTAPENYTLMRDLAKMNSNKRIVVE